MKKNIYTLIICILVCFGASSAHADSITTTFSGGMGFDGNMFDVVALKDLTITTFDGHVEYTGLSNPNPVVTQFDIYYRQGGYSGFEFSQADWTLAGSAYNVVSNGIGNPTPIPISVDLSVLAGETYGFYITAHNYPGLEYTRGTAEGAVYSDNGDLQILEGVGVRYLDGFADPNGIFSPRVWNGTIYYNLDLNTSVPVPTPEPATILFLGIGLTVLGIKRRKEV